MKPILVLITILLAFNCKAQSPLYKADPNLPPGTYYKDMNNDLDKFEGTWVWQDGNASFTMVLQLEEQYYDGDYYRDILKGEYQYINEDGVIVINTLPLLNDASIEALDHNISGSLILNKFQPLPCFECGVDERRVKVFFNDPQMTYKHTGFWLRHRVVNGVEFLEAKLIGYRETPQSSGEISLDNGGVPFGEYVMIKQE